MTDRNGFRISLLATAAIAAATTFIGWRNQRILSSLMEQRDCMLAEARAAGLTIDAHSARTGGKRLRPMPKSRVAALEELSAAILGLEKEIWSKNRRGSYLEFLALCAQLEHALLRLNTDESRILLEIIHKNDTDRDGLSFSTGTVIVALSKSRPADAIALIKEMAGRYGDHEDTPDYAVGLATSCVREWARRDPLAAVDWLRHHAREYPDLITADVKQQAIGPMVRVDPALALKLVAEFGCEPGMFIEKSLGEAANTDGERQALLLAMREFANVPDHPELSQQQLLSFMMRKKAGEGFEEASRWLESGAMTREETHAALSGIYLVSESVQDTGRWIEWLSRHHPDLATDQSERLMQAWTKNDYPAAAAWLRSMPEGPVKQAAAISHSKTILPYFPDEAARLALIVTDETKREELLDSAVLKWRSKDEAAANAFARDQGLPADR